MLSTNVRADRAAAAKAARAVRAQERHAAKLHAIAVRRAQAYGLSKQEFIAGIVSGKYRPITADDLKQEPDAVVEAT